MVSALATVNTGGVETFLTIVVDTGFTANVIVFEPTRPERDVAVKITVGELVAVGVPEMYADDTYTGGTVVRTVVSVNPLGNPDADYETIGSDVGEN